MYYIYAKDLMFANKNIKNLIWHSCRHVFATKLLSPCNEIIIMKMRTYISQMF